jgi:hypothetical protein
MIITFRSEIQVDMRNTYMVYLRHSPNECQNATMKQWESKLLQGIDPVTVKSGDSELSRAMQGLYPNFIPNQLDK